VLTIGDAWLLHRLIKAPVDPLALAAFCACVAAAWAAYGAATRLKGPWVAAICLAQLPVPLAMTGIVGLLGGLAAPIGGPVAVGLVLTAGADALVARLAHRRAATVQSTLASAASFAAVAAWIGGIFLAAAESSAPWSAASFAAAAVIGAVGPAYSRTLTSLVGPAAVLSGALTAVSLTITVTAALPARWDLAILAACGSSVTVGALAVSRRRGKSAGHRLELGAAGSAATLAAAGLGAAPVALGGLFGLHRLLARLGGH